MTTNADSNKVSLLAHLAYEFSSQTELVATKSLAYILSRSEAARNALRDTLKTGGADVGPIARVQTEVIGKKMERIDLSAYNDADEERILIEAKFWAGLTGNQPSAYLSRLPNDGAPSALLFVAPEMRLETLWPHIQAQAEKSGFALDSGAETGDLRTAAVAGSERRLMLTSWRAMLGAMASRASQDGDSAAERDILQLNALCEQQDTDAFIPLKGNEFGPEFPRRLRDLRRLVDDATDRALARGSASTRGLKVVPQAVGYGRYLRLGSKAKGVWAQAWLGVSYELWLGMEGYPLWVDFIRSNDMALKDVVEKIGYRRIPLYLPIGVEYEVVLDEVAGMLEWLAGRISGDWDDAEWESAWPGNAKPA